MRIAFFTTQYDILGGVETVVRELAKRLSKKHEVFLITRRKPVDRFKEPEKFYTDYLILDKSLKNFLLSKKEIDKFLKENKIDLLHLHNFTPALPVLFYNFPKILTFHGTTSYYYYVNKKYMKLPFVYLLEIFAANSSSYVTFITEFHKNQLKPIFKPKTVIYNGVDINLFKCKRKYESNDFTVLFVGKLDPWKGIDRLIMISKKLKNIKFKVIGDGPLKEYLLKNKPENLEYLGPIYDKEKLVKGYCNANLLILPSYSEGLPLVLLEAMSSSLPFIASNVGGNIELVRKSKAGFLAKNVDEFVSIINNLSRNPEVLEELAINGRLFAEKNLNWNLIVRRYLDIYQKVL